MTFSHNYGIMNTESEGYTMPEIAAYGVILGVMILDIIIVLIFDK